MIKNKYLSLLYRYYNNDIIKDILNRWNESHRYYHNIEHLKDFLNKIDLYFIDNMNLYDTKVYHAFIISAFFHDIIYDVKSKDNEDNSIDYFIKVSKNKIPNDILYNVINLINVTKNRNRPNKEIEKIFWEIDNDILINGTLIELIIYEDKIRNEYSYFNYDLYKQKRIEFLNNELYLNNNIKFLIDYINKK